MCNILLRDPSKHLWQVSVNDNGILLTTLVPFITNAPQPPILRAGFANNWMLTASNFGQIVAQPAPTSSPFVLPYLAMQAPGGVAWKSTINTNGILVTTPLGGAIGPDLIPYPLDVSMSRWPVSTGIFCYTCGNAAVTVSGDLSCWCCACNSFVLPEDTNEIVILEE